MHRVFYPLLALAAALTPALPVAADSETGERIDAYVRGRLPDLRTPGLSVVVVQGNQVTFSRGYGFADRESATPMTEDTPIAIGSTNKGMTALAMMIGMAGALRSRRSRSAVKILHAMGYSVSGNKFPRTIMAASRLTVETAKKSMSSTTGISQVFLG